LDLAWLLASCKPAALEDAVDAPGLLAHADLIFAAV
jgi:hypothetical protein